ncbi:M20/M25/M40 family metallo-hydrolase [Pedobacter sp. HMF7647]|uniref:M20/M25/M40 family metallo-hydrolase n=1 Tax=Hufsiella arboris TaxID=2695275 RepID=A0A7K1Y706_9SPHI|nr:M20/M25/M40 family metallo-hydrolase [Hufsiella arboris]MXV49899.1 M20/M25/M40 family metallo-hydrolase [Hufsiella arboris]
MKNKNLAFLSLLALTTSCAVKKQSTQVSDNDVSRIIKTLTSDDMQGRGTFTPGIAKASSFIEKEFKNIGLEPLKGESGFAQSFTVTQIAPASSEVIIDGSKIADGNVIVVSDQAGLDWNTDPSVEVQHIKAGETFFNRYRTITRSGKKTIVYVDESFSDAFKRIREYTISGHIKQGPGNSGSSVFILGINDAKSFRVNATNKIEEKQLNNVAGMIPGKSKASQIVVFSGHYDHLGIIKPVNGDSIANGADDDASGVTAVISLAKYYKALNNNERTLIFVAFTAEEIGGYGSHYFSEKLNPDSVTAMFNIEMIGKDSKFGKNTAFITGYEKSDFGQILQKNLEGTDFKFYPDPYPSQNLFYRSDNATLAALGVPAHTISTDQIDVDKFYHTVDDEFETLDVQNIIATIKAIALSSRSIVSGTDTPKRIPPLTDQKR